MGYSFSTSYGSNNVTAASVILRSNKIQNGDVLVATYTGGLSWKVAVKQVLSCPRPIELKPGRTLSSLPVYKGRHFRSFVV